MAIDDDGKLTDDQRNKFSEWINSKAPLIGKCPTCGHREWSVLEHFVDLPIYRGGNIIIGGGPHYPNVGIICRHCGNTQILNAVMMGVLDSGKPKKEASQSRSGLPPFDAGGPDD